MHDFMAQASPVTTIINAIPSPDDLSPSFSSNWRMTPKPMCIDMHVIYVDSFVVRAQTEKIIIRYIKSE